MSEMDRIIKLAEEKLQEIKTGETPESYTPPPKSEEMPSLMKQGMNFLKAGVKHVAGGMKKASQEEIDRRLGICKGCPFFVDGDAPRCTKCGCHMNLKARWETAHCPIQKW